MPLTQKLTDNSVAVVGCSCLSIENTLAEVETLVARAEDAAANAGDNTGEVISLVEAPSFTLPAAVSILGGQVSFTATAKALLAGATIASYELCVHALGISKQPFANGNLSFIVPAGLPDGSILLVEVVAVDSLGNRSKATIKTTQVKGFSVNAPTITVPANGAEIENADYVAVSASAFATSSGEKDTHIATDWQMGKDAAMTQIVQQALNSKDLVSHVFTNLTLESDTDYYLRTRYQGQFGGWSPYSGASRFRMKSGQIITPSGNTVYRHESNEGSVLLYALRKNGRLVQNISVVVADASKRGAAKWYAPVQDSTDQPIDVGGLTNYTDLMIPDWDVKTGTQNTDTLVAMTTKFAAAHMARGTTLGGAACSLPNIQTLYAIFMEREALDAMDPTIGSYPAHKLSDWNFGNAKNVWSSTEYGEKYAWAFYAGATYNYAYRPKTSLYEVIPIIEL